MENPYWSLSDDIRFNMSTLCFHIGIYLCEFLSYMLYVPLIYY